MWRWKKRPRRATPADGSANATNRAATASHADTTADAADEDFEEGYEEEGFEEEGMEYAEEEGYENEFAINASESETRDFDDGLEGQVGSVDWLIDGLIGRGFDSICSHILFGF